MVFHQSKNIHVSNYEKEVFTYMKPLMNFKSSSPGVSLITTWMVALERLLTGMCQFMGLKMALSDELLVALLAYKGSFTSMSPHMCFKVPSFSQLFQAALKWTNQNFLFILWPLHLFYLGYTTLLGTSNLYLMPD